LKEENSGTSLVAAEIRGGWGESLVRDDRRDHTRGIEECGYE
jgi:hypothetical protein